jgi:hypothetical protein
VVIGKGLDMNRLGMFFVVLMVGMFGTWSVSAQKELNKDPLPFPTDGAGWMALSSENIVVLLQSPGGVQDFALKVGTYVWEEFQREAGPEFERLSEQAETAWDSTLTRVVTVILGGLLLWLPHRLYGVSWLFIGIVAGVLLVQTDSAAALLTEIFPDDVEFRTGVVGVIIAIGLVSLMSGIGLGVIFFIVAGASGWFAGALLGADILNNGVFDLASPLVYVPAIAMSIAMAVAVGRSSRLIATMIGAALVVAALRLAPSLIPVIGIAALIVSLARTKYAKAFRRERLDSLNLSEGKVTLEGNSGRKHLHGLSPEMQDDSNNSPFKAL